MALRESLNRKNSALAQSRSIVTVACGFVDDAGVVLLLLSQKDKLELYALCGRSFSRGNQKSRMKAGRRMEVEGHDTDKRGRGVDYFGIFYNLAEILQDW